MRIGIVGGALQGMEAVLLSGKAGIETLVIDRKGDAPAGSLSDSFMMADAVSDRDAVKRALSDCDFVIPACEEIDALTSLNGMTKEIEVPFLFDMDSYTISCSKEKSNEIMASAGVPLPKPWPECGFPAIVKPSSQSGSIGVCAVNSYDEMECALKVVERLNDTPIVQEFVSGKSVSVEVIGNGDVATPYVTTEVVLDVNYDCKRVICEPRIMNDEDDSEFARIGRDVAEVIRLRALMDVEAILTDKGLRVLEIDARIPSQTPAAVEAATGINLLQELAFSSIGRSTGAVNSGGCSVYEHYVIENGVMRACGEKEFGHVRSPRIEEGFLGSDLAITDHSWGKDEWRVTVISSGRTPAEVLEKRKAFIRRVMSECDVTEYIDESPRFV
ncbi:MAG: 3-methylornithine--L-lysine ligase PylC [Candidatus Methanoplasma sp.]|jgi:pyrrolysine biosynthesis protein PylC|nr:3-methylornithine--L-lysine ligase PylC [Candidatus Methanoplasma sp.]